MKDGSGKPGSDTHKLQERMLYYVDDRPHPSTISTNKGTKMNRKQREHSIGYVYDGLQACAEQLAQGLGQIPADQRVQRWARIQGLLQAADKLEWAVKQVDQMVYERKL